MNGIWVKVTTEDTFTNIHLRHYGSMDNLDQVMELNRKAFVGNGLFMPVGQELYFPKFDSPETQEEEGIWSE